MNEKWMIVALISVVTALPSLLAGYFIAHKKRYDFISNWDPNDYSDADAYAVLIGRMLVFLGCYMSAVIVGWSFIPWVAEHLLWVMLPTALVPLAVLIYGRQKYALSR